MCRYRRVFSINPSKRVCVVTVGRFVNCAFSPYNVMKASLPPFSVSQGVSRTFKKSSIHPCMNFLSKFCLLLVYWMYNVRTKKPTTLPQFILSLKSFSAMRENRCHVTTGEGCSFISSSFKTGQHHDSSTSPALCIVLSRGVSD